MALLKEKNSRRSFVKRENLNRLVQSPSVFELYDLMHITTCELAIDKWDDKWMFCPVCGARWNDGGGMRHRKPTDFI